MKKSAFGAIDLLIGLLITSAVFLISMKAYKGMSSFNKSSVEIKSIENHVNQQINDIENKRKQINEYNKNTIDY